MFRIVSYLLIAIFLITILRNIIGLITRLFTNALQSPARQNGQPGSRNDIPLAGELKKDPVCGTYTSAATSLQQTVGGQTFYFCSPQCRDKFALTRAAR